MFGPYYTGRVIDVLSAHYDQQIFMTAISCMFLTSMGSSIAAGLRGGLFMLTLSRFVKRLRGQLFGSIVHQEIAFFESTRTGEASAQSISVTYYHPSSVRKRDNNKQLALI
eukprot:gi/632991977/ref/XP_007884868.1/ PREDICTED: antigen peptide transporter 2-like [Callorhinchus milii]